MHAKGLTYATGQPTWDEIRLVKVQTMTTDSENVLGEILSNSPGQLEEEDLETVKLAGYILVGAVLEGSDELARQMKSKEMESVRPDIFRGSKIPGETSRIYCAMR